jgi:FkbM family methyltransferase
MPDERTFMGIRSAVNRLYGVLKQSGQSAGANSVPLPPPLVKHLEPGKPISLIDLGAYQGQFTRAVAAHAGITTGILIEPIPHLASDLRDNFSPPRYAVCECVVAAESATASFEINPFEATSSLLPLKRDMPEMANFDRGVGRRVTCVARTLDDIVAEVGLTAIDLLKIDVQGAELLALAGATETLKKTERVWIEVSFRPLYESSCVFAEVYAALNDAGFRLTEIEPGYRSVKGELLQADALFQRLR